MMCPRVPPGGGITEDELLVGYAGGRDRRMVDAVLALSEANFDLLAQCDELRGLLECAEADADRGWANYERARRLLELSEAGR